MEASHARPSSPRSPYQTRPRAAHGIIAIAVFIFSCAPLWIGFQYCLKEIALWLLSAGRITVVGSFSSGTPSLIVKLLDGSKLSLLMTFQRCGLVSTTISGLLLLLMLFPLGGSLMHRIIWMEIGLLVGLAWGFLRLLVTVLVAYYFGAGALAVADFVTGPLTDIFWVLAVWSLALSTLISRKRSD